MPTSLVSTGVQFPDSSIQTTAAGPSSFTLLGTLNTTSGTSQTLSGLNLTSYQYLYIAIAGVSYTASSSTLRLGDGSNGQFRLTSFGSTSLAYSGWATVSLRGYGTYESIYQTSAGNESVFNGFTNGYIGSNYITRSTTAITFDCGNGAFDAGQIQVYGVK